MINKFRKLLTHKESEHGAFSFPTREYPEVYNKEGRKLDFFYFRDQLLRPYSESRYFMWDRSNYGLDTHFYSQHNILYTQGKPTRKFGMLVESKGIVPDNYKLFDRYKGLNEEFDSIFTYDAELLDKLPNAKFYPGCSEIWYGKQKDGFVWDNECYQKKCKGISIVSSDKKMCHLHEVRFDLSVQCKRNNLADTFGTFDGGANCLIDDTLRDYRYSIAIENDISDFFFTEKITNCFAAQTIPIYLGARRIDQFFNKDGIIQITEDKLDDIENILSKCTPEYYNERIDAVLDNYNRVYQYQNVYDWLYEHYFLEEKRDRT